MYVLTLCREIIWCMSFVTRRRKHNHHKESHGSEKLSKDSSINLKHVKCEKNSPRKIPQRGSKKFHGLLLSIKLPILKKV